jgi:hypothetical protein
MSRFYTQMYRIRETPPKYIKVIGYVLGGLTAGFVFGLRGIRGLIGAVVLAFLFMLALDVLRRRVGKK